MIVAGDRGRLGSGLALGIVLATSALLAYGCTNDDDGPTIEAPLAVCGDGIVEGGETCDDENDDPRDDCTNDCRVAACGDGVASAGEACDDADADDEDSCTATCTTGPAAIAAVAAGEFHTCAVSSRSVVRCWGAPDYGRLGQPGYDEHIGDDEPPSDWDPVEVADDIVALSAGSDHTCALRQGGQLRCWGSNNAGQLGYGNTLDVGDDETPASAGDVPLPRAVSQLATGGDHTCAVFDDGSVACWGSNESGQLGYGHTDRIGDDETVDAAGFVSLPGAASKVVAGDSHSCALLQSGDVSCWGRQAEGQLGYGNPDGIGDDEAVDTAGAVPLGGKAIDLAAGTSHTCALLEGGTVRCWGSGGSGQLGYGDSESYGDRKTPEEVGDVMLPGTAVAVVAGRSHTCAVMTNGNVHCWGGGHALGIPDSYGTEAPEGPATIGVPVRSMVAGYGHNCAVLDSAALRCWGDNTGSVLGYPEVGSSTTVKNVGEVGEVDIF